MGADVYVCVLTHLCVDACVRVCVFGLVPVWCVCMYVCVCGHMCVRVCVRGCV